MLSSVTGPNKQTNVIQFSVSRLKLDTQNKQTKNNEREVMERIKIYLKKYRKSGWAKFMNILA